VAEEKPWETIRGLSYRDADGVIHHNIDRPISRTWTALPSVVPVYERDLRSRTIFIGYLKHPYMSSTPAGLANRTGTFCCGRRRWAVTTTAPVRSRP